MLRLDGVEFRSRDLGNDRGYRVVVIGRGSRDRRR
jgi:hypothetical protein